MTRLGIICSNKALATMNNGRKSRLEEHKKGGNREETKIQTNEKKNSTHFLTWFLTHQIESITTFWVILLQREEK